MSGLGLNTGLKALLSSRLVLDTIGNNIANANTPGFSRQRVGLSPSFSVNSRGLLIGSGVDTTGVSRSVDALLGRRILGQHSVMGGLNAQLGGLDELEALFGDFEGSGIGSLMDGFFSSVSALSSSPEDAVLRSGVTQAAQNLTLRFQEVSNGLARIASDTDGQVAAAVEVVNGYAAEIAALNVQIGETESAGLPANDLLDRRDFVLDELSKHVDVTVAAGPNNSARVMVAGNTLVSSDRAHRMTVVSDTDGGLRVQIAGASGFVPVSAGTIGGLLELGQNLAPSVRSQLDELAHGLILGVNRVHSTGIPSSGPLNSLIGVNELADFDLDGKVEDELLSNAGLPFEVSSGALYVNVSDLQTGALTQHKIDISSTHTTVRDFLEEINDIPQLSADLESGGRVRILANQGYGFDFSSRVTGAPDAAGTFGGAHASLGTAATEPFTLADGATLDLTVDVGGTPVSFQVAFDSADFAEISSATAEELADALNAEPDVRSNGLSATAVDGALFLQSTASGTSASFTVDGGSALAGLGWSGFAGIPIQGQDFGVDVQLGGSFTGTGSTTFSFRPTKDGVVGTTADLQVEVMDAKGELVTVLDLGPDYVPGAELSVADGITVRFGLGELSATNNDAFAVDLVEDTDTTDVLVALGLNTLFQGSDSSDIALNEVLADDPGLLATGVAGESGDNALLVRLLGVAEERLQGLDGLSIGDFYGKVVGDLGFEAASTRSALSANEALVNSLERRRDDISGVNVDEELVDLLAFEQSFQAAAQYISVVNELGEELLSLI